jgi:ABC-type nitrate/sulfonate/bicarbonate transport system permease component
VAVLLVLWQGLDLVGVLPDYVLGPWEIAKALVEQWRAGLLGPALTASILRGLPGFLLGTTAGALLGLLAGTARPVEDVADPIVSLTYPLPKIALFPVFAVWLGFTDTTRILVIALVGFYPAFVNALGGARGIDQRLVWAARNVGAGRWRAFWQVILPGALPLLLVGARISLALSFVLVFATEAYGASQGLGWLIYDGYLNLRYDIMYAAIATLALAGFAADQLLLLLGRRLTHGHRIQAVGRG